MDNYTDDDLQALLSASQGREGYGDRVKAIEAEIAKRDSESE